MAKSNKNDSIIQKLREENEILRDAATYDGETIKKLKAEVAALKADSPAPVKVHVPDPKLEEQVKNLIKAIEGKEKEIFDLEFKLSFAETSSENFKDEVQKLSVQVKELESKAENTEMLDKLKDGFIVQLTAKDEVIADLYKKLEEKEIELTGMKDQLAAGEKTINKLKGNMLTSAKEIKKLNRDIDAYKADMEHVKELEALMDQAKAVNEQLEKEMAGQKAALVTAQQNWAKYQNMNDKGPRRWRYIDMADPRKSLPKGQNGMRLLVCCVSPNHIVAQAALNPVRIDTEFLIRDATFYPERDKGAFDGVPDGYIVAAWQPIVEPDYDRIADITINVSTWSVNNEEFIERSIKNSKNAKVTRAIIDKAREVFDKRTFTPLNQGRALSRTLFFKGNKNLGRL